MIITLCGPRKNLQMFDIVKDDLETKFHIVLEPNWSFSKEDLEKFTDEQFRHLHEVHYRKMAMSDAVVIIDYPNPVGYDTQREITMAKSMGIPIYRLSPLIGDTENRGTAFDWAFDKTSTIESMSNEELVREVERRTENGRLSFDVSIASEG